MVEAYTNATRMRLNIKIKAPIIVIPVDSQSLQAIAIDLGYLFITNACSEIANSAVRMKYFMYLVDFNFPSFCCRRIVDLLFLMK